MKSLSTIAGLLTGLQRFDTNLLRLTTIAAAGEQVLIGNPTVELSIDTITADATDAVVTTDEPHGLEVGNKIQIAGCAVAGHNGIWEVSVVTSSTVFEFESTADAADASDGTVVKGELNVYACVASGAVTGVSFVPGGNADASATNLAACINAGDTLGVTATAIAGVGVAISSDIPGSRNLICAETLAGANNAWSATETYGGTSIDSAGTVRKIDVLQTAGTAVEIAVGRVIRKFGFPVGAAIVDVRATAGTTKAWDGVTTITDNEVMLDNSGDTDLLATDEITIIAAEAAASDEVEEEEENEL